MRGGLRHLKKSGSAFTTAAFATAHAVVNGDAGCLTEDGAQAREDAIFAALVKMKQSKAATFDSGAAMNGASPAQAVRRACPSEEATATAQYCALWMCDLCGQPDNRGHLCDFCERPNDNALNERRNEKDKNPHGDRHTKYNKRGGLKSPQSLDDVLERQSRLPSSLPDPSASYSNARWLPHPLPTRCGIEASANRHDSSRTHTPNIHSQQTSQQACLGDRQSRPLSQGITRHLDTKLPDATATGGRQHPNSRAGSHGTLLASASQPSIRAALKEPALLTRLDLGTSHSATSAPRSFPSSPGNLVGRPTSADKAVDPEVTFHAQMLRLGQAERRLRSALA